MTRSRDNPRVSLRAAGIEAFGDEVALLELPEPPPLETGQVVIEVKAAGVANWDEFVRTGDWDVTAVGPAMFHGDFGWHTLEPAADEACKVVPVPVRFGGRVHVMLYGRELRSLLAERWDLVHCWEEP